MNIRCPSCQSVFRVDPTRIPPAGIRARCSRCSAAFMIRAPGAAATPGAGATSAAAGAEPAAAGARAATATATRAAPAPTAPERAAPTPAVPPAGETGAQPGVFGTRDPHARAQRIARALVSDIVAYHPRKRDEALANSTMRTEFREEIMKSWEEYVAQVGNELAKSTPYFRNALNEILAKGQRIF